MIMNHRLSVKASLINFSLNLRRLRMHQVRRTCVSPSSGAALIGIFLALARGELRLPIDSMILRTVALVPRWW